jgi:transcriptional regulator with XRE-family HTH domain
MVIESIGARIARLRRRAGIKQLELAQRAGLNPSSLNQIEKGKRIPKTSTVDALAKELDVSRDLILDGDPAVEPRASRHNATPQNSELSATIQAAISAGFADLATAIAAALADWHETHTDRETRNPATGTAGRPPVRRDSRR